MRDACQVVDTRYLDTVLLERFSFWDTLVYVLGNEDNSTGVVRGLDGGNVVTLMIAIQDVQDKIDHDSRRANLDVELVIHIKR